MIIDFLSLSLKKKSANKRYLGDEFALSDKPLLKIVKV